MTKARDISKLSAVEVNADATDTTNVTSSGALMDSELTNLAAVKAINQSLVTTAGPTFGSLTVDTMSMNGSSLTASGNLTLDVAGDIILDPDGNDILLKDNGVTFGQLTNDSGQLIIYNAGSQMLKGNSGSNALFMGTVTSTGNITAGSSTAGVVTVGSANGFEIQKSGVNAYINQSDSGPIIVRMGSSYSEKLRLDASGNLGINVTPTQKLHVGGNAIITGITRLGNGTESSPAYQFVDDTNTGMYRSSSDVLGFSTGGTNRLTLNSTGATFAGTVTAPTYIMTGGSQIGQDFAYLKSNSTTTASLTLRKDASGADSIDFLQLRNDGNGLIGTITGAGAIQATAGATSAPTYSFVGDTNTGISRPTSDAVNIVTGGSERVRINSSGQMGLGTVPESSNTSYVSLEVGGRGMLNAHLTAGGFIMTENVYLHSDGNWKTKTTNKSSALQHNDGEIIFYTAASATADTNASFDETMRIDSLGNVGIGTSSPSNFGTDSQGLSINGTGNYQNLVLMKSGATQFYLYTNGTSGTFLGTAVNQPLMFMANDAEKMRINSNGYVAIGHSDSWSKLQITGQGTNEATIFLHNDTDGDGEYNGIIFKSDSTNTNVRKKAGIFFERTAIRGQGTLHFCVEASNSDTNVSLSHSQLQMNGDKVSINGAGSDLFYINGKATATAMGIKIGTNGYNGIEFDNATGSLVGRITINSGTTAYITSSDYRLKENVVDMTGATTRLKQLKPKRFNWIADDTNTPLDGFLAHEVSSVVPEAVAGEKDAVHPDGHHEAGEIDPQGLDYSKLVPLLVKTIQELEARITALEA